MVDRFEPDPSMKLLIANRGEIARRVARTATALGIPTVAVFADPDRPAPHVAAATEAVRIGPAGLDQSYLSIPAILEAAAATGATHVHPGYGFLAERGEFARAVVDADLTWVGPAPEVIDRMGSKIEARGIAASADVPTIPGFNDSQDADALRAAADELGYPVLIKASAGGGGKGIRIVHEVDGFAAALDDARAEARRAFGDDAVIVERYVTRPRHIEVQIAGDAHGTVIDLGTRECSVQRRYQKVLEEAPAPNLPATVTEGLRSAARDLAVAIGYDSIGTVEFILDDRTGEYFFLEMNTRIQVEHTVTEEITGVDLVELQLALADRMPMPVAADVFDRAHGHAIEARINAEDAWQGHVPQTGVVRSLSVPSAPHIRWDGAIEAGSEITPHYDSMIGKLVVSGDGRIETVDRLERALRELAVDGVTTNVSFHRWLLRQRPVRAGKVTTRFLDEVPTPTADPFADDDGRSPWSAGVAPRLTPHRSAFAFASPSRDARWDEDATMSSASADRVTAPFPGLITEVAVRPGDEVAHGQVVATIEAMKMLHPIAAPGSGVVDEVLVETGTQVAAHDVLVTFTPVTLPDQGEST